MCTRLNKWMGMGWQRGIVRLMQKETTRLDHQGKFGGAQPNMTERMDMDERGDEHEGRSSKRWGHLPTE